MKSTDPPIVVAELYNAQPDVVWAAITRPDLMRKWFFEQIEDFEAKVGFKTEFTIQVEDRTFPHLWEVTEVVPGEQLSYKWEFGGYPGSGIITFALRAEIGGTLLTLTNTTVEDFPEDIPEFARESCVGGWNYFLKARLKAYLEGDRNE